MNDCVNEEMRDALPDLIHGGLDATRVAEVEAHVASCAVCATELELLRAVVASAPAVPTIDVGRMVAGLPTPTRQGFLLHNGGGKPATPELARRSPTFWSRPLMRIAAAAAIVSAGGLSLLVGRDVLNPETQVGPPRTRVVTANKPAAPVVPQSAAVAASVAPQASGRQVSSVAGAGMSLAGETQELSDEHLATLLNDMEGMDGMPSAEPEIVIPAIDDSESIGGSQ
jgi:hypothetical protein